MNTCSSHNFVQILANIVCYVKFCLFIEADPLTRMLSMYQHEWDYPSTLAIIIALPSTHFAFKKIRFVHNVISAGTNERGCIAT